MYKVLGNNIPTSHQADRASTSLSDSREEESNISDSGTTTHDNAIAHSPSQKNAYKSCQRHLSTSYVCNHQKDNRNKNNKYRIKISKGQTITADDAIEAMKIK